MKTDFDFNKIIEAFNKLSEQVRYGILAGVVFLIIALDVFFILLPQMGAITDINDQISKLSSDTQQVITDKSRINVFKKNMQDARDQSEALALKVLPIENRTAILSTISNIANQNKVTIDQMVPNQLEVLIKATEGEYCALPVVIKAHASYHDFGRFLDKLEKQDLYFSFKDFIIQNDGDNPKSHLYTLTLKIVLLDRGATKN